MRPQTPPTESKNDKFARLARTRLDKVRYYMGLVRNLATNTTYEYTKADIEWIRNELNNVFDEVLAAFDSPKG